MKLTYKAISNNIDKMWTNTLMVNPRHQTALEQPLTKRETPLQNTLVGNATLIQGRSIDLRISLYMHK